MNHTIDDHFDTRDILEIMFFVYDEVTVPQLKAFQKFIYEKLIDRRFYIDITSNSLISASEGDPNIKDIGGQGTFKFVRADRKFLYNDEISKEKTYPSFSRIKLIASSYDKEVAEAIREYILMTIQKRWTKKGDK